MPTKSIHLVLLLFSIVIAVTFLPTKTNAQNQTTKTITPIEQAKQDYSYQTTKYQDARDKYLAAKSNYQAFDTAVAKNEAFARTQEYIIQIHNVYTTYLLLINERSNLYDWGTSAYSKDDEHKIINAEIKKLEALKDEALKLKTLEDTVEHSTKMQEHVSKNTLPIAYKLLVKTDFVQILEVEYLFGQNFQKINDEANTKISERDRPLLLNWQSEVSAIKIKIKDSLDAKKPDLEKAFDVSSLKVDLTGYEFHTNKERQIFFSTPGLLEEILNLI